MTFFCKSNVPDCEYRLDENGRIFLWNFKNKCKELHPKAMVVIDETKGLPSSRSQSSSADPS